MALIGSNANCSFNETTKLSFILWYVVGQQNSFKKTRIHKNPLKQPVLLSDWLSRSSDPTSLL